MVPNPPHFRAMQSLGKVVDGSCALLRVQASLAGESSTLLHSMKRNAKRLDPRNSASVPPGNRKSILVNFSLCETLLRLDQ